MWHLFTGSVYLSKYGISSARLLVSTCSCIWPGHITLYYFTSLLHKDFVFTSATRRPIILWFKMAASEKKRELDVISSYQTSGYLSRLEKYANMQQNMQNCNLKFLITGQLCSIGLLKQWNTLSDQRMHLTDWYNINCYV